MLHAPCYFRSTMKVPLSATSNSGRQSGCIWGTCSKRWKWSIDVVTNVSVKQAILDAKLTFTIKIRIGKPADPSFIFGPARELYDTVNFDKSGIRYPAETLLNANRTE